MSKPPDKAAAPPDHRPWEELNAAELDRLLREFTDDQLARRFWVPLPVIHELRTAQLGESAEEPAPVNPAHDV